MQLVITPEESGRLDLASSEPVGVLMERAGLAVALAAVDMGAGYGARVAVLAGTGNNGGDGYVAAKYLARRGCAVTVYTLGPPKEGNTAAQNAAGAAEAAGVRVKPLDQPEAADLLIDAMFGVGFSGSLPDVASPWTEVDAPVLAVDVPSGLDAASGDVPGEAFTADRTVTFHAFKPGHLLGEGPERCGIVTIADIGLRGGKAAMLVCGEADAARPRGPGSRTSGRPDRLPSSAVHPESRERPCWRREVRWRWVPAPPPWCAPGRSSRRMRRCRTMS